MFTELDVPAERQTGSFVRVDNTDFMNDGCCGLSMSPAGGRHRWLHSTAHKDGRLQPLARHDLPRHDAGDGPRCVTGGGR